MVFSELLLKLPYSIAWHFASMFRSKRSIAFYAHEELDYEIFKNVHIKLPQVKIIASNRKLADLLAGKYHIEAEVYPAFPDVVIMARHSIHKFPIQKIKKIGMRHGPYHFKNFIAADKYNRFDLFLFTSEIEAKQAEEFGIKVADCGGFPKCDSLLDENLRKKSAEKKSKLFSDDKPTLLFSSTWDKSGISGVNFWFDRISELSTEYNILVTLHPWIDKKYVEAIKSNKDIKFVESTELYEYMLMSDILIADTSSIIAEYMLLRRPIITFKIEPKGRLSQEIADMLSRSTFRVSDFDELKETIKDAYRSPSKHSEEVDECLKIMFAKDLGEHSKLASEKILNYLKSIDFEF